MPAAYADLSLNNERNAALKASARRLLRVTAIAVVSLSLLAIAALIVASREMNSARASYQRLHESWAALEHVQNVLASLQDAESGERGFIITGNEKFLDPDGDAKRVLEERLTQLRSATNDPNMRQQLDEFARLAQEQIEFLRQAVETRRREGFEATAALVASEVGKRRMDEIRGRIDSLRSSMQADLTANVDSYAERTQRIGSIISMLLLAASSSILVAGALLYRHMERRFAAEQAANDAVALLRAAMEQAAQGVAIFDPERRLIAWNHRFLELRELRPEDVRAGVCIDEIVEIAAPLRMQLPGGELDSGAAFRAAQISFAPVDGDAVKPNGAVLRVQGRPMPNGNYIITYTDLTNLKQSELAYRDQASRLSAILDNVVDAIITINESGSIESWSNGAERLFGYKAEEVLRRNVRMLMPEPHASSHDNYIRRYLQTGERRVIGMRRELEGRRKDGQIVPVDLGISELYIGRRRVFIGIVRDISERREVERLKSSFVSTVSHELRTPLTSISGSLGLLSGGVAGELPPKAARLIEIAKLNSERLVRLINDILDLEKAEAGRLEFRFETQQIKSVVQQAIDLNRAYAHGFGATIELDPNSDDAPVLVDRDRLVQVLTNLLSNAAKFSPRGGVIAVRTTIEGESICIAVHDQGPGIPAEFQSRIFQRFAQADSSDSRAKGGTGLGLSIAKAIVERLGGAIGFESAPGMGTTFRVSLPIRYPHASVKPVNPGLAAGSAVLVCEDDPDVAELLADILRKEGMRAETVGTARAARAAVEAVRFDVAIVDLHLPDADGLQFINELRARQGTRTLPVIVVTAKARSREDPNVLSALHLADWLQKPIDRQRLLDSIRAVLSQPRSHRARILYVEDDASLTQLVRELLQNEVDVVAANSLAAAKERVNDGDYDLVILDIALGDGNGLDLLPLLGRRGARPPVILYSATEASHEISGMVQAALVKSRDSLEALLSNVRALARRADSQEVTNT
jgi:PAS domain S-box-containing protein